MPFPVDLSKLSDVVKNDVIKKDVYNAKIKNIDKIPDITKFAADASVNAKINEVKGKIPSITNVAATRALTSVENKIPGVIDLVKTTDYNTKIDEIQKKRADLASKSDIAYFINEADFDKKLKDVTSNKNELNELSEKS